MGQKDVLVAAPAAAVSLGTSVRPTWVRYQVLGMACLIAVLIYIHRVGFGSAAPYIKEQLSFDPRQQGRILAAFLVAYALFEIPWGVLGDRIGVRHVLTLLLAGSALTTAAAAYVLYLGGQTALPYAYLLAIRFLCGAFQAGIFPSLSRMMADWMPVQERATAQGLIWMSSRIGGALAPLLIVELIAFERNWAGPLILVAFLAVPVCIGFWSWFRNTPQEMSHVNAAEHALIVAGRTARPGHGNVPWSKLLRSRSVWALCLMYGFGGTAATFFVTYLPTYLNDERHLSADQTKWLTSLPLACGVVACVLGGLVSDWIIRRWGNRKWGRRLNGTIGAAIAGFAYLSIIWVREPWALGVLLCGIFFFNDLGMGPAWASCADIGRRYAGTLGGAMNMIGNLGGAAGNVIAGHFFDKEHQQPAAVFIIFAVCYWLGMICWLNVDVTKPIEGEG
jgi:ACS family glucarate transporter-like MFS transporter